MSPAVRTPPNALSASTIACALLLVGCAANSQLTNVWKDASWTARPMRNVYVVALRPDPVRRRMWEDGFVEGLARYGIAATASYHQFPAAPPDTQQAVDEIRSKGYDGVVVLMRLPDEVHRQHVPGYTRIEPVTRQHPFTGGYYIVTKEVREPGHIEVSRVRSFRTDVWITGEAGRLVWSGTIQTLERLNSDLVRRIAATQVVDEMSRSGILPPEPAK